MSGVKMSHLDFNSMLWMIDVILSFVLLPDSRRGDIFFRMELVFSRVSAPLSSSQPKCLFMNMVNETQHRLSSIHLKFLDSAHVECSEGGKKRTKRRLAVTFSALVVVREHACMMVSHTVPGSYRVLTVDNDGPKCLDNKSWCIIESILFFS